MQADLSQAEFRCLGHYCLHGSTYVLTRRGNGRYTISKIVNQKLPIQVKSYDFESDTIEYQKVQGWFKGGIKDWTPRGRKYSTCNWLKIYHKHHEFPLTCTPNHMIFTFNRGWVKAGDLRVGDLLAIDIPEATYEQQQLILGTLLGDGNFSGVSNMWFYSKNKEYFEFKKLALGKLVTSFRLDKRGIWRGYIIAHPVIRQLKKEMVINGVKYPTIPALQRLDALGLAIWYCDDGSYDHYRGYNCYIANARITLNETNFINRKFGLHFRYYKNKGIWLTNKSDVYQFMELISKYVPPCMQYKLDPKFRGRFVNPFTYQGKSISPSPVTRIQHVNKKSVMFDIEVCKNHNFFANRVLVSNSRDPNLIKLINEKKDIHRMLASLAYGKEESEISDNERTIAKTITFGIMYGRGAKSIAEQFGISIEEAQKIRNLFFETFPEATKWMQKAKEFAKKYGFVKTLTGRKIPLPKVYSKDEEEVAYSLRCSVNYPIQSTVADMTNLAGALIYHEFKKQKLDAYLLLNIHDALVIECHEFIVDKVKELVIDIMKNRIKEILKLRVDLDVDVKIGKTLDLE
ncbi:MAG: hypothetical protein DRO67_07160 [Candidatus Asgardarchaeum californiense]|nr:MAG: hypothetical protein DRO67_07160 [Candidatus Asgardarchaeum californiense]